MRTDDCDCKLPPPTTARSRRALVVILLLALASPPIAAQQPVAKPARPDSAGFAQAMGMLNQMGPMYETMMQAMVEGTLKALERPETVERMAAFARRYYEALMKQGFSKEDALQIVAGAGLPGRPGPGGGVRQHAHGVILPLRGPAR